MLRSVRPWLISLLVHALLFFGMWQLRAPAPATKPTPITVSLWQAPAASKPATPATQLAADEPATTHTEAASAAQIKATAVTTRIKPLPVAKPVSRSALSKPTSTTPVADKPASHATPAMADPPANSPAIIEPRRSGSLFERASGYLQAQQQRELSQAELKALSQRAASPQSRPIAKQHQAELAASGMASNVLDVLDDGRQLVKVGQSCFLASPNTDLLKDPLSAKSVPCEQKVSTADQINSILEQRRNRHLGRE